MFYLRLLALLFGIAVLSAGGSIGQDKGKKDEKSEKKDDKKDDSTSKGQLPANWKQIGLTDEQKQSVYKINAKFKNSIANRFTISKKSTLQPDEALIDNRPRFSI